MLLKIRNLKFKKISLPVSVSIAVQINDWLYAIYISSHFMKYLS